jgi:adenylate cyclase
MMLPALIAFAVASVVAVLLWWVNRRQLVRTRAELDDAHTRLRDLELSFRRFAPAEVVNALAERDEAASTGRRQVTVLFADLKGFTALSERIEPEQLVDLLNGYLQAMDGAVAAHHGRIAKFMGDGLLALFGAMHANPWQARDAVHAALAMRAALDEYNASASEALAMGVGIHSGEVVAGVMGSARLREFTVIGDVVNTAARVESLTRTHDVDILITDAVRAQLEGAFRLREMTRAEVKGKAESLATWAVDGRAD